MAGKTGLFNLSKLISIQGYDCIVEVIFTYMDPPSLAKCRLVSKSWKALIDTRRSILVCQLQQLKQNKLEVPDAKVWYKMRRIVQSQRKYSIIEKFPELRQVFLDLERNATGPELSIIVRFLKNYSKHQQFPIGNLTKLSKLKGCVSSKRIIRSPLHQAIIDTDQEFVSIIMKRTKFHFQSPIQVDGQKFVTYLALAVFNLEMVKLFLTYALEKHINLNVVDGQGRTAFHYACMHGTTEVVKLFLENVQEEFLQVNLLDEYHRYSALHFACIGNQPAIVQLLLDKSAQFSININPLDTYGHTPLHAAIGFEHEKVVKVLLEASIQHDINVNALDFYDKTPFTIACQYGRLEIAKLMIEESRTYGIDLNMLDWNGDSAMYHAIKNKHLDIARVMIDESKEKGILLNQEDETFTTNLLTINAWIDSFGGLVFGRRLDLCRSYLDFDFNSLNPLLISYYCSHQLRILHLMKSMIRTNWIWRILFICVLVLSLLNLLKWLNYPIFNWVFLCLLSIYINIGFLYYCIFYNKINH